MAEHTVYGPPGTGKTTYLSAQAKRASEKYGGGAVAIASLTRAAAAEVGGRDTGIPDHNIGTLHAHAYRALDHPKLLESSKGLAAWNDWVPSPGLRLSVKAIAADPENAPPEAMLQGAEQAEECYAAMNVYRARMTGREWWPPRVREFDRYWQEFQAEGGYTDFTSWLERCLDEGVPMKSEPYVLMLDEAQDFSRLEMSLARSWAAEAHDLVVVGDPDQNLYEWRGADPLAFRGTDADGTTLVLQQSYRVPKAVHETAVAWIEQVRERERVEYRPRDHHGTCERRSLTLDDPSELLVDVDAHLAEGMTVMILASCSYMLNQTLFLLRERGTPFHNPYRRNAGHWNPMRYVDRVLSFLKPQPEAWGDEADFWRWNELRKWTEVLRSSDTLHQGAKQFIKAKCRADRFGESEAEGYVDAGVLFTELLKAEGHDPAYRGDLEWWEDHLLDAHRKAQSFPLRVARVRGPAALRVTPKLVIGTIHSVKGGEADVVYLFPDLSGAGYYGSYQTDYPDPVIRQFYVGMTRARDTLYLCQPSRQEAVRWL